jgi:hypothetical protein
MKQIYKFLYTIKQITKYSYYQASRLTRQLNEIFRAIVLTERKKECDSGDLQEVVRNSHGFPTNFK